MFRLQIFGLIYLEKDDGEIAYQFHMTILNEDLLDSWKYENFSFTSYYLI